MCMMVFLASDYELPEIEWQKDISLFYIKRLGNTDIAYSKIKRISKMNLIYYAGSYEGCGCGFTFGGIDSPTAEEIEDWNNNVQSADRELMEHSIETERKRKSSVKQLFEYLRRNVPSGRSIELYSYLAGNEGDDVKVNEVVDIDDFSLENSFEFKKHQLIRYYRKAKRPWWKSWLLFLPS